jgi:hypothetical protein
MPASTTEKPHAGRVALVTGAARGIGRRQLLRRRLMSEDRAAPALTGDPIDPTMPESSRRAVRKARSLSRV